MIVRIKPEGIDNPSEHIVKCDMVRVNDHGDLTCVKTTVKNYPTFLFGMHIGDEKSFRDEPVFGIASGCWYNYEITKEEFDEKEK